MFMVVIGVVLFGTMALVTPFMQNLLGYPIQTAGFLLGSRGVGTLITMMVAPRLMRLLETRYLILIGLLLTGGTLYVLYRVFARHHADHHRGHQRSSRASASACCSCRSPRWRSSRCRTTCAPAARRS